MTDERAAFYGIIYLCRMETERAHVARIKYRFSIFVYTEGVCRVINDLQTINVGDFLDALHITGGAINVHGHNRCRVGGDCRFNLFGIDVSGFFFYVNEHRFESVPPDGVGRSDKTIRRGNDFSGNFHRLQCCNERKSSVSKQADVLDAQIVCQGLLESLVVVAVVCEPLAFPDVLEHWDKVV